MRLPNGYGSVYKLSGNRRKPWIARKTITYDKETLRQHYETIGYYETQAEALQKLAEYNANPYDLDASKTTFSEVYKKWSDKKYKELVNANGYRAAYALSEPLHKMRWVDIRKDDMQDIINGCGKGYATRKNLKTLYGQLYQYTAEHDFKGTDYSKFVSMGKNDKQSKRKPFTQKEIDKLWKKVDSLPNVDYVLISIYSGWRPGELVTLENTNINFEERTMLGGIKTDAGKDRIVPISNKILALLSKRVNLTNEYFMTDDRGKHITYDRYRDWFLILMEQLNMNHKPHDTRHTFATLMDNAGANRISIKRIIGHASIDVTEGYTHKDIEELIKAIDLI